MRLDSALLQCLHPPNPASLCSLSLPQSQGPDLSPQVCFVFVLGARHLLSCTWCTLTVLLMPTLLLPFILCGNLLPLDSESGAQFLPGKM